MSAKASTAEEILDLPEVQSGIKITFTLIERTFQSLCKKTFSTEDCNGMYLNKFLLLHVVESYYCDLYRLTSFRGITADYHKQAAFLVKWITRLRPVQLHADAINPSQATMLANEILALTVGLITLFRSVESPYTSMVKEAGYLYNLVYILHYHGCASPEQLASELYQLEQRYLEVQ